MEDKKFSIFNFQFSTKFIIHWALFIIIILLYFLSRLINLDIIPVFCDEAIYIRWAQIMKAEPSLRFIPLSDGKQPLFMWLIIPVLKIIEDPLIAGRMVSVLAGFGTMIGMFILGFFLFKNICFSFFFSIFYLVSPYAFFFDRLALTDGLLSCFGVWCLVIGISLVKKIRLDLAMILGIFLGLGLITKSPALFFVLLLPITLLFFDFKRKNMPFYLIKLVILWGIALVFAFAIYNILRLGPEFHMVAIRNKDYVFSLKEVLKHPLNPFLENFKNVIKWFWILTTPPVFILGLLGMLGMLKKDFTKGVFLLVCFCFPLFIQSAVAKVFTARYLFFSLPIFLIFAAWDLEFFLGIKNKKLAVFLGIILFIFPVYQIYLLSNHPQKAWLPQDERKGYLEQWTSGYGIKESALYLKKVVQNQKVLVGTEGYFGTLPEGLQIYLEKVPNITIVGVGYPIKEIPEKLTNGLIDNRVFMLVNDSRFEIKDTKKLNLIAKYPKAKNLKTGNQENLLFFEILP